VGVSAEGDLVATASRVQSVRSFAAAWEYMLDRAFIVIPHKQGLCGLGSSPLDLADVAAPGAVACRREGYSPLKAGQCLQKAGGSICPHV